MGPIEWMFRDSDHDPDLFCTDIPDAFFDEDEEDGFEEDFSDSGDFSDVESAADVFFDDGGEEDAGYDDGDPEEFDRNGFDIPDVTDDDIPQSTPHKPAFSSNDPPKDYFARMFRSCILEALALVIVPVNLIEKQRYCDPDDFFGFTPAIISISFGLIYASVVFYLWISDGSRKPLKRRVIDNLKKYRRLFVILAIIPAICLGNEVHKSIKLHSTYMEAVDLVVEKKWGEAIPIICDPDIYYDNFTDAQSLWWLCEAHDDYKTGFLQEAYNKICGQTFEKTPSAKRKILYSYADRIAIEFRKKYPDGEATHTFKHKPRYTESTHHYYYGGGSGGGTTATTCGTTGWTTKPTTKYTTRRTGTATTEYDRLEASKYSTAEDFYYENYYDFFDYYEAENYYNEHHG